MDPINFDNFAVVPFATENPFGWRFRVTIGGGPFPIKGLPPIARLGAQQIQHVQVSPDGRGFGGYLRDPPANGDKLFFGYLEPDEIDTGLTYSE